MSLLRGSKLSAYLIAGGSVAIATVISLYWPVLFRMHMLAAFLIAVVFTAFYGGLFPSLLAIAFSALSFDYFIAPPAGWGISDPADRARLASFVVVAAFISFLHWQRIKAENKHRSMVQRLSLALEATKFGVWDLDLRSGVVWHSPGMEEIVGRGPEGFATNYEAFRDYIHPDDREFVHHTITRCVENGDECQIQHRIQLPSGETRWVGTRARVFHDQNHRPERLVAVTFDNTNRATDTSLPSLDALASSRIAATA
jgi:PAS domain S-box-containing protein